MFMSVYIYTLVDKWVFMKDDSLSSVSRYVQIDKDEIVSLNQTGIIPYFVIWNIQTLKGYTLDEVSRYFTVEYRYD